jgi:membrane protein
MSRCSIPTWKEFIALGYAAYEGWFADRAPRLGASLAFYTLLSLAPIVIVVVAVAGFAFGERAAEGRLVYEIQDLIGHEVAVAVQGLLATARSAETMTFATLAGLIALFFGATAVLIELRDALNTIWKVQPDENAGRWSFITDTIKERAFSFALVVGIGFLLMVSLVVNAWLAAMGTYFGGLLSVPEWLLQLAYAAISFSVISFLFAVIYKVLPAVRLEWGDVLIGAAVTSLLFTIGRVLIGLYLGKTTLISTYGAAGSLVVVLIWVYYSAQIFFFGAEFTRAYTERHGSVFRRQLEVEPERPDNRVVLPEPGPAKEEPVLVVPESFEERKRRIA